MSTRRRIVAAITLTLALTAQTGCVRMIWSNGKTHGIGVETKALPPTLRVNFLVYRAPTDALYKVYRKAGIEVTQDVMWSFGKPPRVTVYKRCHAHFCFAIGEDLFKSRVRGYIYDDPSDLRTALIEAAAQRKCLAPTLFSNGSTRPNWTKKSSGCRTGSIPGAAPRTPALLLDASPVASGASDETPVIEGPAEPDRVLTSAELALIAPEDRQFVNRLPEVETLAPEDPAPVVVVTPAPDDAATPR